MFNGYERKIRTYLNKSCKASLGSGILLNADIIKSLSLFEKVIVSSFSKYNLACFMQVVIMYDDSDK